MAKRKVYVCYSNYGDYEGCSPPVLVTFDEVEARKWQEEGGRYNSRMTDEWEVEEPKQDGVD